MRPELSVTFTTPQPQHVRQAADLRWEWALERDRTPLGDRLEFAQEFEQWCEQHRTTHPCIVALNADDQVVGFGFVAMTPRVPAANLDNDRLAAEIQAVFVAPELRNEGIGARLIDCLLDLARAQGAERVAVHSSAAAITAYERAGFTADPRTMSKTLPGTSEGTKPAQRRGRQ